MQMESLQGGGCKWWQVALGSIIFLTSPVTGLVGAAAGVTIAVSAC